MRPCALLFLLTLCLGGCFGCTSASARAKAPRPLPEVSNDVDPRPTFFALSDVTCPKASPSSACKIVEVRLDALASSSMVFPNPFDATTSGKSLNLKKTTEEGLEAVLADATNPATATVTYKYQGQTIPFVIKNAKVFSSFNLNGKLTLKPCEARTLRTVPNCHLLMFKPKPLQ